MSGPKSDASNPDDRATLSEERILECCLRGEDGAWECLFRSCQPRLLGLIEEQLRDRPNGRDLAEEIASSVWYSLVSGEKARLRRFDPSRGTRLLTYMVALGRREIWKRLRREHGRRARERQVARVETTGEDPRWGLLLDEFLATLTRREREFCTAHLMAEASARAAPEVSDCNGWQLRSRVRRKLLVFTEGAGEGPRGDREHRAGDTPAAAAGSVPGPAPRPELLAEHAE